jgi:tryptophan synthase beta chain
MRHLGILATTPEGAALCFREFCQDGFAELGPHDHPDVTLDCVALARSLPAWQAGDYASVRATLSASVRRLASAGAGFFACPDNTSHRALEEPGPSLPLPGLHIAEVVADQAARDGRRRVGLLGTNQTMTGPVYPRALAARQIATEIPGERDRAFLDELIVNELVNGVFTDRARQECARIIERLAARGCDAVALACTEIPLLLPAGACPLPALDSTRLLARAAFDVAAGRRVLPTWRGGPVTVPRRGVTSVPDLIMGDPDDAGFFGEFGGRYVPEPLMAACKEVEDAFRAARADPAFRDEFARELANYAGRPSPLTESARMSERLGVRLLLKREDLMHTGSHKINNVVGQALLARRMGKKVLIAETGAGQHGVAVATAAALYGMKCVVYMGEVDMRRQAPNVFRMGLLGAEVIPTTCGSRTLKDAVSDAMRRWVSEVAEAHFCDGSVVGPHPYPWMVREFQRVIGDEARDQCRGLLGGRDPDVVVACVGGGSNAAGIFAGFAHLPHVALVGAEAMGSAAIFRGRPGVVHGAKSFVLQDEAGQILESTGISAGLGYPGIGPEHSYLAEAGRARYVAVTDDEVLAAFQFMASTEGIIPALEPAHAIAWVAREREALAGKTVLVNLSGRGDKDIDHVRHLLGR